MHVQHLQSLTYVDGKDEICVNVIALILLLIICSSQVLSPVVVVFFRLFFFFGWYCITSVFDSRLSFGVGKF